MNCTQCQDQLFEYLDGTLPDHEREQLVAHLAGCPGCSAVVEAERAAASRFTGAVAELQLPAATRTRLTALLCDVRPRRVAWWHVLAPVAGAILVAVGVWRWQSLRHQPSWIECQATTYSETHPDQWVRRSLLVYRRNGSESFLQITVKRPEL